MIDTVRFKIKLNEAERRAIEAQSTTYSAYNNRTDTELYRVYKTDMVLGSYDRHVNIYLPDGDTSVYLEFSAPKYFFGHNIFLLYYSNYKKTILTLYEDLKIVFGEFPSIDRWRFQRIDVCYAWKFESDEMAQQVLETLRVFIVNHHDRRNDKTSFTDKGVTLSLKWYLKHPEFFVHDFRELKKDIKKIEKAYTLLDMAKGVLRFEVTLRKRALEYHFGEKFFADDLKESDLEYLLDFYFSKVIKCKDRKFMSNITVFEKLKQCYKVSKARSLYLFYRMYYSDNDYDKKVIKNSFTRQSIAFSLKGLKNAGIGIPSNNKFKNIDLNIPSDYCVNPKPLATEGGGA